MNSTKIDPVEWDFRGIAEESAPEFIQPMVDYEYARECQETVGLFVRWKETEIEWLDECGGRNLLQVKLALGRRAMGSLSENGRRSIYDSIPVSPVKNPLGWALFAFLAKFPEFPKPWSQIDARWKPPSTQWQPIAFEPVPKREFIKAEPSALNPAPVFGDREEFRMHIDWTMPPTVLKKAFSAWMNSARPKDAKRVERRGTGKPPFEKLKWLAAYRIAVHLGLSYRDGQIMLRAHKKALQIKHSNADVYPLYQYQSGWDSAIRKAELYRRVVTL